MAPLISVIVPVYKTEPWRRRCADSFLAQTFSDFELLLVDDSSPDGSGAVCDGYAARDGRVRVIHKENGGVMSALNAGIRAESASHDETVLLFSDRWAYNELLSGRCHT